MTSQSKNKAFTPNSNQTFMKNEIKVVHVCEGLQLNKQQP
jgi:hypothetical protein